MRLIDADELKTDYIVPSTSTGTVSTQYVSLLQILNAPTVDVVERKAGKWIWDDEGYHCSECFFHAYGNTLECLDGTYRFCPNCGAKMEEPDNLQLTCN